MRRKTAGFLILLMIAVTILTGFGILPAGFNPLWVAGIAAWLAALLLFIDTSRILKIQVSLILLIGRPSKMWATHIRKSMNWVSWKL